MTDQVSEEVVVAPPKKRGKKFLLIGLLALLLLVGIGAGLYFSGMLQALLGKKQAEQSQTQIAAPPKAVAFFDLPSMLVNLNTASRHPNYLKLTISLQIEDPADAPKLQALLPRLTDTCQSFLRELRLDDLKGSAGLYRLREELQMRISDAAAPIKIDDVLFKELLVQ
ncbi:MAG TPA: flagellar basal body-associated FliL family protein [Stellaceae bacterium]|jgi:flagellar FliL protein|nr:flagellar basal body-associated FliL family protein [Stellaceae bacterium]